jgi:hypothetical protein
MGKCYPQMNTDVGAGSQIFLTINDVIHKPALHEFFGVFVFLNFLKLDNSAKIMR